jgi:hypothetical protein
MTNLDPSKYIRDNIKITVFVKKPNWFWLRFRLWLAFLLIRLSCWVGTFNPPVITSREEHLERVMREAALVADSHIVSCERGECKVCDTFIAIRDTLESELTESNENEPLYQSPTN